MPVELRALVRDDPAMTDDATASRRGALLTGPSLAGASPAGAASAPSDASSPSDGDESLRARPPATFANVDDARDPGRFRDYLAELLAQAEIQRYKKAALDLCDVLPGQRVLDVGSGTGADALELAARVGPSGTVTGVEPSVALIEEARRRAGGDARVRFCLGSAEALGFDDASFDVVRADRVLVHLSDPAAAVREMVRVTRPGGRIVLTEGDFDTLVIDAADASVSRKIAALLSDGFASGTVGRSLVSLLLRAGAIRVASDALSVVFRDRARADRFWGVTAVVEARWRWASSARAPAEAWLADQSARDLRGEFFCSLTGFSAVGTKP